MRRRTVLLGATLLVAACGSDEPETDPITGRVLAFDGAPIAALGVQADSARGRWSAVTRDDGRFTIGVPPDGAFLISTTGEGWPTLIVDGVRSGRSELVLQMAETFSVSGVLVDDAGAPLAGRLLALHNPSGESKGPLGQRVSSTGGNAWTAEDGSFEVRGLLPGPHVTDVPADPLRGSPQLRCTTEIVTVGSEGLRLVATKEATVSGVVLDPAGLPAAHAELHVGRRVVRLPGAPELQLWMSGTMADQEGRFALTGLPPGPVEITVNGPEWTLAVLTVDAPASDVEVRLAPPRTPLTKGRVVAANGEPLAAASLRFTHESREALRYFGGTDANGDFVSPHLRDGRYVVEILETHGDWHGPARRIGVIDAGATGVILHLEN